MKAETVLANHTERRLQQGGRPIPGCSEHGECVVTLGYRLRNADELHLVVGSCRVEGNPCVVVNHNPPMIRHRATESSSNTKRAKLHIIVIVCGFSVGYAEWHKIIISQHPGVLGGTPCDGGFRSREPSSIMSCSIPAPISKDLNGSIHRYSTDLDHPSHQTVDITVRGVVLRS